MLQCCISSSAFWKGDSWQKQSRKSRNKQNYLLKIYIFSSLIVFKCLIWWELNKDYIFHNFKKSMSANVMHHVYCRLLDIICTKVQGCVFSFFGEKQQICLCDWWCTKDLVKVLTSVDKDENDQKHQRSYYDYNNSNVRNACSVNQTTIFQHYSSSQHWHPELSLLENVKGAVFKKFKK